MTYVYDQYYVFSTVRNIEKLMGIWVNATTEEVELVKISGEGFHTGGATWKLRYCGTPKEFIRME